ncbi:MAG: hypothetical protein COB46_06095 [Rhodospirillaceae bacterium]|nr:MAG: hypothetical protein COB46_06095 [Rhodospirillaceae bacterium]
MADLVTIILPFFALVVMGFVATKFALLNNAGVQGLNRFVYYFALPALLFSKMSQTPFEKVLLENTFMLALLLAASIVFVLGWIIAKLLFSAKSDKAAIMALAGCYGNIGFLGIPVLVTVLGESVAAPLSIMVLIDVAILIPFATSIIDVSRTGGLRPHMLGGLFKSIVKNPLIVSIVVGLLFSASGLGLPTFIGGFSNLLGQAAAPAAMFALGAVLAGRPLSDGLGEASVIGLLKLTVHPLVMWGAMTLFGVSADWRLAATLGAATPVGAALFVIAQEYDAMPTRASTAVVVSTAVALISLPVLISWLT